MGAKERMTDTDLRTRWSVRGRLALADSGSRRFGAFAGRAFAAGDVRFDDHALAVLSVVDVAADRGDDAAAFMAQGDAQIATARIATIDPDT